MTDFSFTATASCQYCGALLSSSEETCDDCCEDEIYQQMFRRMTGDSSETVAVRSTLLHKWDRLEEVVGGDWQSYQWLGPRSEVQSMVGREPWPSIEDVPYRAMPHDRVE